MQRKYVPIFMALSIAGSVGMQASGQTDSCPQCGGDGWPRISRWAIPSDTGSYIGYYVGGGCGRPHYAEPRRVDEGTWGWDYQGWFLPRRVILGWWHGREHHDGTGSYKTDGPQLYHAK